MPRTSAQRDLVAHDTRGGHGPHQAAEGADKGGVRGGVLSCVLVLGVACFGVCGGWWVGDSTVVGVGW